MNKIFNFVYSGYNSLCALGKKLATNPRVCMMLLAVFSFVMAFADGGTTTPAGNSAGVTALEGVATDLGQYIEPVQKVCYALAGVVAIIGAISVYLKMNNEEQDVKKSIMMVVGACIFLIAAAQALPLFFSAN